MKQQQEAALLAAFRVMNKKDRSFVLTFAKESAAENKRPRPTLKLIVCGNPHPPSRPTPGSASG